MPSDMRKLIDTGTVNNQIIDSKEIVYNRRFAEGCTLFGRVGPTYFRKTLALREVTS
jgi:hypothetical protein